MTDTLARPDSADDARHHDFTTHDFTTHDFTTHHDATADSATHDSATGGIARAAWDAWAARVDGERDISVVLDALPRAHAAMAVHPGGRFHPLAPVDGVLAVPDGVVGPFAGLGRPGRPSSGRHFVRLTGRRQPAGWGGVGFGWLCSSPPPCGARAT